MFENKPNGFPNKEPKGTSAAFGPAAPRPASHRSCSWPKSSVSCPYPAITWVSLSLFFSNRTPPQTKKASGFPTLNPPKGAPRIKTSHPRPGKWEIQRATCNGLLLVSERAGYGKPGLRFVAEGPLATRPSSATGQAGINVRATTRQSPTNTHRVRV